MKRSSKKDKDIKKKNIDVRPLNQRETKMDTRKGMERVQETVNIKFLEQEQLLFPLKLKGV